MAQTEEQKRVARRIAQEKYRKSRTPEQIEADRLASALAQQRLREQRAKVGVKNRSISLTDEEFVFVKAFVESLRAAKAKTKA